MKKGLVDALLSANIQRSFEAVGAALKAGVNADRLITTMVLLAADRMARTPVNVEAGWDSLTTELNLAASLRTALQHGGNRVVAKGLLHVAWQVFADRWLNIPARPLTTQLGGAKLGVDEAAGVQLILQSIASLNVQDVGRLVLEYLNAGYSGDRLLQEMGRAMLWDDTNTRVLPTLRTVFEEWERSGGTDPSLGAGHPARYQLIVGLARYATDIRTNKDSGSRRIPRCALPRERPRSRSSKNSKGGRFPMSTQSNFVKVAELKDVPEGTPKAVKVEGRSIALFQHEGSFYATDNQCPHMGYPLTRGRVRNGVLTCDWHGWSYDMKGGGCFTGGCDDLATFPVEVRDGSIFLDVRSGGSRPKDAHFLLLKEGLLSADNWTLSKAIAIMLAKGVSEEETLKRVIEHMGRHIATESGPNDGGRELAMMVNGVRVARYYEPDDRLIPLMMAATGASGRAGDRPAVQPLPPPVTWDKLERWIHVLSADKAFGRHREVPHHRTTPRWTR
jgi:nitrite reductase/ring-hydroxylating ferredoxin subunit